MFKVLIACLSDWDTLMELPYILKKGGCEVDVYCSEKSWALSNNYYDKWIESSSDKTVFRDKLFDLVKNGDYQWVIPGDEPLIKYLNETIHLPDLFVKIMPIINIQYREMLSSKVGLADFCKDNDIDAPGYRLYNNCADLDKIRTELNFPVINKQDFSWGGVGMFVSDTYEQFVSNIGRIPKNQQLLIQEFIDGVEVPVEALFYQGELLMYNTSRILQYDKDCFTYSTKRIYFENRELEPLLIKLGKKLGINGFVNIAYMHDQKKDKFYLIEVDTRPNSWISIGRFTGHNFSTAVKRIVNGEYVSGYQYIPIKKPSIEMALFYKDIRRALWQRDLKGILKWVFNYKGYWRFLPFYDSKLTKRIFKEIWDEIFLYKWKRVIGTHKEAEQSRGPFDEASAQTQDSIIEVHKLEGPDLEKVRYDKNWNNIITIKKETAELHK
jgi:glutathione synthase/RimK-type ligase-like ATP-grasp enzyme